MSKQDIVVVGPSGDMERIAVDPTSHTVSDIKQMAAQAFGLSLGTFDLKIANSLLSDDSAPFNKLGYSDTNPFKVTLQSTGGDRL